MKNFPESFSEKLLQRQQNSSLRKLPKSNNLIDFSSNDYLGLARSETLFRQVHEFSEKQNLIRNGATGSRLLSGNFELYEQVENYLATFHEAETALIFNSGYAANLGFFGSISDRNSVVLYDELSHASIRDGIRLSGAKAYKFRHNDLEDLNQKLQLFSRENRDIFVVTESVFSMDGDTPDMPKLTEICLKHNAFLVIDEAHALGVFGEKGEGLVQHLGLHNQVFARIMTFGKALGCHGAAIIGSSELKDYLINFSRSFIYTTALSPHSVAAILLAYQYLEKAKPEREKLQQNIELFNRLFHTTDFSAIKSILVSGNENVKQKALQLQQSGYDVKPILSPTVAQGQERLRFCLHSYNTEAEIRNVEQCFRRG
ncbi:MAG: pyridoxal phosphate-dependent aminotransferase family protein [Flavobacteriaceae bacterium]